MKYYYKDNRWTAVPNSSSKYWEVKEFGNCKCVELNVPILSIFGWEKTVDGYKRKNLSQEEFENHLKELKKLYNIMTERINSLEI